MTEYIKTPVVPDCAGPDPDPRHAGRFIVPAGAVDTHAHVVGVPPHYPLIAARRYTAPPATPAEYIGMLDATGMTYGVLVQVSVHGTDNTLMVETLRAHPARLRGIAVVEPDISEVECAALKDAGVVGLRINTFHGGGRSYDDIERYGALCQDMGWHLQIFLDAADLTEIGSRLARLKVPLVFDHLGLRPTGVGIADLGFQNLLAFLRDGAWVKLSGAYRFSEAGFPYVDTVPFARALAETAPDRCVWGSDWPHVGIGGRMPNVGDLLDLFAEWVPVAESRDRILVGNPGRLYGFPVLARDLSS